MRQLKEKPTRKRVGFISSGAPARAGVKILDDAENEIGIVTSGCPAPSLKGKSRPILITCELLADDMQTKVGRGGIGLLGRACIGSSLSVRGL